MNRLLLNSIYLNCYRVCVHLHEYKHYKKFITIGFLFFREPQIKIEFSVKFQNVFKLNRHQNLNKQSKKILVNYIVVISLN